jgi:hypothetical protein
MRNTGSPSGDRNANQLATRERQAGLTGMAERLAVPTKPGNSDGGKEPQLLIKMWLEAPVEETDEKGNKYRSTRNREEGRGTPQGAPISPLLSNLYNRPT